MSNEWINLLVLFVAKGFHPYLHTLGAERQTLQNCDLRNFTIETSESDQVFRIGLHLPWSRMNLSYEFIVRYPDASRVLF